MAYYEAKWDFKVPKIHSSVVKLVYYLKQSVRISVWSLHSLLFIMKLLTQVCDH